jgi:hypothetical protein
MPKVVQVGPYTYKVVLLAKEMSELYGETDSREQAIRLHPDQARDSMADTLLHEVLHAVWHCSGLHDGKYNEEQVVRGLTTWLLLVLRDNPELVSYLCEEEPEQVRQIAEQLVALVQLREETGQSEQ